MRRARSLATVRPLVVSPPLADVYRVHRAGLAIGEPTPWQYAAEDGAFRGRYDDPSPRKGIPQDSCFRTLYFATERDGAFGESVQIFIPRLELIRAIMEEIDDDEPLAEWMEARTVTDDWRSTRRIGKAVLDRSLRIVDVCAASSLQYLRYALAVKASKLAIEDIDVSVVTGPRREFTQEVARYIYEQVDEAGMPLYDGIRYVSRLNSGSTTSWECWAIFDSRLRYAPSMSETIFPDDAGLMAAASLLGLCIENIDGTLIVPERGMDLR